MSFIFRILRGFWHLLLPLFFLLLMAAVGASVFFVYKDSVPARAKYLNTPDKYGLLSARGARVTDENWANNDGTQSRGWLLRGFPGSPAVILLHKYGADRSYTLDLGVRLNEATNFTVLMPDMRGHGESPMVDRSAFGGKETDDLLNSVAFLRSLKTDKNEAIVGEEIGVFGVEMGAFVAIAAAEREPSLKAFVLDSVPRGSSEILRDAHISKYPFLGSITSKFADFGAILFYATGGFDRTSTCDHARRLDQRKTLLIAGTDSGDLQMATEEVGRCFPNSTKVQTNTNVSPSGYRITAASIEQIDSYNQKVIQFMRENLVNPN